MKVSNLFAFLHFLWNDDLHRFSHERKRVQFSLFLLLCIYTSSRSSVLIESSADDIKDSDDALHYRDIKLILIRNSMTERKNVLILKIILLLMKEKRHMKKSYVLRHAETDNADWELTIDSITYVLHEQDDNLTLCSMLHFLALAFFDNVFRASNLDCFKTISQIKILKSRQVIQLEWKDNILNKCIFRRAEKRISEMKISNRVLSYYFISKHFRKIEQDAEFCKNLTLYVIHQVTDNVVNDIYHRCDLFFDLFANAVQMTWRKLFVIRSWVILEKRCSNITYLNRLNMMFNLLILISSRELSLSQLQREWFCLEIDARQSNSRLWKSVKSIVKIRSLISETKELVWFNCVRQNM